MTEETVSSTPLRHKVWRAVIPAWEITPYVTNTIIGINVLVFVTEVVLAVTTGMTPAKFDRALGLQAAAVEDGQIYRLVTSAFVHAGVLHLALNMLFLYWFGPPLELWLGRARFIALYMVSLLGSAALICLLPTPGFAVGASGALFGLLGASLILARLLGVGVNNILWVIGINMAITFGIPAVTSLQISWQGHVGGLITGIVFATVIRRIYDSYLDIISVDPPRKPT